MDRVFYFVMRSRESHFLFTCSTHANDTVIVLVKAVAHIVPGRGDERIPDT